MGRIVKTFLHVFLRSFLPTTHYYSKILKTPISFSFKYFFTLLFILNVFFVSYLVVKYNPAKINAVLTAITSSLSKYPDNLVISLKKGYLITNNNRPYFLWLDYQDKKNLFLVIDESASPQKIQSYRSTILLTAKDLVTYDRRTNMFSSFPLLYAEDQRITKEKVNEFVQSANKLSFIFPVIFVIGFLLLLAIIPLSSLLITVIYLILASSIVFLLFKFFMQKHFHFKKIVQISFHAVTLPLLLDYFILIFQPTVKVNTVFLFPLKQIPPPMLFLIFLAVFVGIGVYEGHPPPVHHRRKH